MLKKLWILSESLFESLALNWDKMLNTTKLECELNSDVNMYLFFGKGMRGGVSYISKGCSKANKKNLKSYDPKQESKHIIYSDASNLCGYDV